MNNQLLSALLATGAVSAACALLSTFVVARRWAFIGEGIGHAGFGGAGVAWMLAAFFPAFAGENVPYLFAVAASIATALGVGLLSRREAVSGDVAIGIFLVAAVAVGFIGRSIFIHQRHASPAGFDNLFFGQAGPLDVRIVLATLFVCAAVAVVVLAVQKELIAYCLDPALAETAGVRVGLIHYLLIGLMAVVIVVAVRVVGTLLVSALLILPGAAASQFSRRLHFSLFASLSFSLVASAAGVVVHRELPYLPAAPCVVLFLFIQFVAAMMFRRR